MIGDRTLQKKGFNIAKQTKDGGQLRHEVWRNKDGDEVIWNGRWWFKSADDLSKELTCADDLNKAIEEREDE